MTLPDRSSTAPRLGTCDHCQRRGEVIPTACPELCRERARARELPRSIVGWPVLGCGRSAAIGVHAVNAPAVATGKFDVVTEQDSRRPLIATSVPNLVPEVDDVALRSAARRQPRLRVFPPSLHGRAPRPLSQDPGGRGDPSLAGWRGSAPRQVSKLCGCALRVLRSRALRTPASFSSTARGEQNAHSPAVRDRSYRGFSVSAGVPRALVWGGSSRRARERASARRISRGRALFGRRPLTISAPWVSPGGRCA